jgi:hypothetical protein
MSIVISGEWNGIRRDANLPSASNFSAAGWVRISSITNIPAVNTIFCMSDAFEAARTQEIAIHCQDSATDLKLRRNLNENLDFSADPSTNVWIYVAYSCAGTGTDQYKGYWWNANGTLGASLSTSTNDAGITPNVFVVGARQGASFNGYFAYIRLWNRVLTQANFEAEMFSPTIVGATDINTAIGTDSYNDVSGNGRNWTNKGTTIDSSGDFEPPVITTTKYMKYFIQSTAVGAEVDGIVFNPGTGGAITGSKVGEFTGIEVVAGTGDDTGKGVLLVPAADFNGSALAVDAEVVALARTSTFTTGIEPGVIVEE